VRIGDELHAPLRTVSPASIDRLLAADNSIS
jgi:hypothetical protein